MAAPEVSGNWHRRRPPTAIADPGDVSGRLFVTEQTGRVMRVETNALTPFLDIQDRTYSPAFSEYGLLSVAFPPGFATNRHFYVFYNRQSDGASTISRFFVSNTNATVADPASEQVLLVVPMGGGPAYTLSGGPLIFGPDGYLYAGQCDSGFSLVSPNHGQDPQSLRGKILRLDVESSTNGYQIPADNPYVSNTNYLPEIWAVGVRNPWRFSFDRATGDFYLADVGQLESEEVNFKPAAVTAAQNYGWPIREGAMLYVGPDSTGISFTDPVTELQHTEPPESIAGGYVYRGPAAVRMTGLYFYADTYSGRIWALKRDGTNWLNQLVATLPYFITTFGEDQSGRLYLADYFSGSIFRMEDSGEVVPPTFNPPGSNSYTEAITLSCLSTNASIHYTTNGADPTALDPSVSSGGTVMIAAGTTLKARALRAGLSPSSVTSMTYGLKAARPAFNPPMGPVTNGQPIAIVSLTPGATIRCTLDGSTPTGGSVLYSGPIPHNSTNILKARAFKAGFIDSEVGEFHLSAVVLESPGVQLRGGQVSLAWFSQTNWNYQIQFSAEVNGWRDFDRPIPGINGLINYDIGYQIPQPLRRLYRLKATPDLGL